MPNSSSGNLQKVQSVYPTANYMCHSCCSTLHTVQSVYPTANYMCHSSCSTLRKVQSIYPTANYMRHSGSGHPTPASTYSAPPTYLKRGADSTIKGGSVLRVTDDLSGRRPVDKRRPMSEVAYGTVTRPRSLRGTLPSELCFGSLLQSLVLELQNVLMSCVRNRTVAKIWQFPAQKWNSCRTSFLFWLFVSVQLVPHYHCLCFYVFISPQTANRWVQQQTCRQHSFSCVHMLHFLQSFCHQAGINICCTIFQLTNFTIWLGLFDHDWHSLMGLFDHDWHSLMRLFDHDWNSLMGLFDHDWHSLMGLFDHDWHSLMRLFDHDWNSLMGLFDHDWHSLMGLFDHDWQSDGVAWPWLTQSDGVVWP